MLSARNSQKAKLSSLLEARAMMRAQDLRKAGISAQTIARAVENGEIERISRGVYQKHGAEIEENQILAEAAMRVPKGVIALVSALAFHGLTDQMPRRVWMAIGTSDWTPVQSYPPLRMVRFTQAYLRQGIEHHSIAGVEVPIYAIPKTLADLFRNPRLVDRSVAVEGLRAALQQRKATPSAIAQGAKAGGAWKIMRPYLEALTSNG
ncbi:MULTISPECIES: type IV toxin-antitoxin system AbiEi family antitoxin domain-containing protein [unclassified Novosphingobium]|nr:MULTISPECIES: AbiEi antitoxin N-terminal domain-containing protein [unclassified Novosphingobium]MBN9142345.1 AbiEi antitoxin N-terminal domain-containing protein [Novosphingobium sp.]ODU77635.1 MAG: transcriptional regulator [Novosphingobium sp. SCN 63-17]OJX90154.1 MAG: transcriptional regulator [Novosphingobium sp. 63-713]